MEWKTKGKKANAQNKTDACRHASHSKYCLFTWQLTLFLTQHSPQLSRKSTEATMCMLLGPSWVLITIPHRPHYLNHRSARIAPTLPCTRRSFVSFVEQAGPLRYRRLDRAKALTRVVFQVTFQEQQQQYPSRETLNTSRSPPAPLAYAVSD